MNRCKNCYYFKEVAELSKFGRCIYSIITTTEDDCCSNFVPSITSLKLDVGKVDCPECKTIMSKELRTHYFSHTLDARVVKIDNLETKFCENCNFTCFDNNTFKYILTSIC